MIADATDATVNPTAKTAIEIISIDHVDNVDPIRDPQVQPRVLARQIPPSRARGVIQLGGPNIIADSANERITINSADALPQLFLGFLPDGTYGMVIAKPGVDVNSLFS